MKQLQNVLYITEPGLRLEADGKALEAKLENGNKLHIPIHNLESVISFASETPSEKAMQLCAEHGVGLTVYHGNGKLKYRVLGETHGNVHLRLKQSKICDSPELCTETAQQIVSAKLRNSASVINTFRKNHTEIDKAQLCCAESQLRALSQSALQCCDFNQLRGIEGAGAAAYFAVFDLMILNQDPAFRFSGRNRRPPKDLVNALLSFSYSMLLRDFVNALDGIGLDPAIGLLHGIRPGKPALALDLMEELRTVISDRFVLRLLNLQMIKAEMFDRGKDGGIYLNRSGQQIFYREWNRARKKDFYHPVLNERVPKGLLPFLQSSAFARWVSGTDSTYTPILLEKCL